MAEMVYSRDGETYYEPGDFIDVYGDELEPGEVVHEGERVTKPAGAYLGGSVVDRIVEDMSENAFEEVGECIPDDWPSVDQKKCDELQKLVSDWLDTNVPVPFWSVRNARELTLTAEWITENTATVPAGVTLGANDQQEKHHG